VKVNLLPGGEACPEPVEGRPPNPDRFRAEGSRLLQIVLTEEHRLAFS